MSIGFVYNNACEFCGQTNPDWKYIPYCNEICKNNHKDLLSASELKDKVEHIANNMVIIENKITIILEKIKLIEEIINK